MLRKIQSNWEWFLAQLQSQFIDVRIIMHRAWSCVRRTFDHWTWFVIIIIIVISIDLVMIESIDFKILIWFRLEIFYIKNWSLNNWLIGSIWASIINKCAIIWWQTSFSRLNKFFDCWFGSCTKAVWFLDVILNSKIK